MILNSIHLQWEDLEPADARVGATQEGIGLLQKLRNELGVLQKIL